MTKQNSLIQLMDCFDDICENATKTVSNSLKSSGISSNYCSSNSSGSSYFTTFGDTTNGTWTMIDYPFSDYRYGRRWNDFSYLWYPTTTITYKIDTPSYPVSNFGVTEDGTSIIEVAVSGFDKEDIIVRREDLKIIVTGKKKEEKEEQKVKYIYKHIAERDFTLEFLGSEKWNFDALKAQISNGILKIEIPIKEECKPVNTTYEIK